MNEMLGALGNMPGSRIAVAALLTIASYLALSGYELLAISYIGKRLSYRRVTFVTWVAYGLGHSLGFPVIAGGTVRARVYSRWGIGPADLARIIGFGAITTWLGVLTVLGTAFLWKSDVVTAAIPMSSVAAAGIGVIAIGLVAAYITLSLARHAPVTIAGQEIRFPSPHVALAQIAVSTADWLLAAGVLQVLLPASARIPFPAFLALFCAAQVAGLVSHVPGGLGVFDAIMVAGLLPSGHSSAIAIVASLAAFRGVYYVAPLAVGGTLLAWSESSAAFDRWGDSIRTFVASHAATILAIATFAMGAVLLFSSATPSIAGRERILAQVSFSPVTESAYFLSSLVGLGLLLLSRGLHRRLDGAYVLVLPLLVLGIAFSILKGLDYEEATLLALLLAALLPARRLFFRRVSLLAEPYTISWVLGIVLVLSSAVWLAVFSSTHVLFSSAKWWHFTFTGGAPVTLGATVTAVCAAALLGGAWLLRMAPPPLAAPDAAQQHQLREVVASAPHTAANLALVGDKSILFSEDLKSFLMYGVSGRSWVAMGDPVGPPPVRGELARRFRALARGNGGRAVFYLVTPENVAMYVDLGLSIRKIGETALVRLQAFTLDGGSRKALRRARKNAELAGCEFAVVPASEVQSIMSELREISDDWLARKQGKEKGFSLGYFDERYLNQCPIALIRQNGRLIAFANIWESSATGELSVDLMRYASDAPVGIMDYLLTEILLWGKARNYRSFDLGMAPLSGLDTCDGSPTWQRFAALASRLGRRFYNFEGVRKYKEKYDPEWEGRYMAYPVGMRPTLVLADVAKLVIGLDRRSKSN